MTKEQALKELAETRNLHTGLLKPLGIHLDSWLRWAQMSERTQKNIIEKFLAANGY